jgi:hypothetical protein
MPSCSHIAINTPFISLPPLTITNFGSPFGAKKCENAKQAIISEVTRELNARFAKSSDREGEGFSDREGEGSSYRVEHPVRQAQPKNKIEPMHMRLICFGRQHDWRSPWSVIIFDCSFLLQLFC